MYTYRYINIRYVYMPSSLVYMLLLVVGHERIAVEGHQRTFGSVAGCT